MSTSGVGVGSLPSGLREHAERQLLGSGLTLADAIELLVGSVLPHGPANGPRAALSAGWHSGDTDPGTHHPGTHHPGTRTGMAPHAPGVVPAPTRPAQEV